MALLIGRGAPDRRARAQKAQADVDVAVVRPSATGASETITAVTAAARFSGAGRSGSRNPRTAMRYVEPGGHAIAEITAPPRR